MPNASRTMPIPIGVLIAIKTFRTLPQGNLQCHSLEWAWPQTGFPEIKGRG